MEMMWGVLLILASGSFGAPLTSSNISVRCTRFNGISLPAPLDKFAPSLLADLKATVSVENGQNFLNISWAINLDSTYKYIEGIEILESAHQTLHCEYIPSLEEANRRSLIPKMQKQMWFSHKEPVTDDSYYHVQACNLPKPPPENGPCSKSVIVYPPPKPKRNPDPTSTSTVLNSATPHITPPVSRSPLLVPVGGGLLIGLGLLLVSYVTYKIVSSRLSMGFQKLSAGPTVPVLVVYPAESAVFHGAVVALAEFLQQYGGCSVAVDMWQQGSVANLGPMRWLLEQVQKAHRVIIVAPQPSPQQPPFPGSCSIPPAAAQDLYPLALNLVASRAKNLTELAKFYVVRFGDIGPLTSELQACQTFCLMKDLNKLCRCLQSTRKDEKNTTIADLFMWHANRCGGNFSQKLRAAVQALHGAQASVVKDQGSDKHSTFMA